MPILHCIVHSFTFLFFFNSERPVTFCLLLFAFCHLKMTLSFPSSLFASWSFKVTHCCFSGKGQNNLLITIMLSNLILTDPFSYMISQGRQQQCENKLSRNDWSPNSYWLPSLKCNDGNHMFKACQIKCGWCNVVCFSFEIVTRFLQEPFINFWGEYE